MKIDINSDDLIPVIERVVAETIDRLATERGKLADRLGFTEVEAAAALGVKRHVLRDARLRGEVEASRIGSKVIYSRQDLLALLERNRGS